MSPPRPVTRYDRSNLQAEFAELLETQTGQNVVEVRITSSGLADLDQDGAQDDIFGTGVVQIDGLRFKSFVFMQREDGAARFFDSSGARLDLSSGTRFLPCFESHPVHCAPPMERAGRVISRPRVSVRDYDSTRRGLEVIIQQGGGNFVVLNSLEAFFAGTS